MKNEHSFRVLTPQGEAEALNANAAESEDLRESKTDRQELIPWWKQSALHNASAIVVGAGAIGNELLKNLALLGFGYVFICDLDHISNSNLSRTVLFGSQDLGKMKAPTAARRFLEMNVDDDARADSFVGNVNAELGAGVFRRMDVVVGCLDNLQTRFETNRKCNLLQKPYFDAGINELTCNLTVTRYPESPCWACNSNARAEQAAINFERNSCDVTKRKAESRGHAATVQVASSLIASLQAQEVVKYVARADWDAHPELHESELGKEPPRVDFGVFYSFNGMYNSFNRVTFREREKCAPNHDSYDEVIETPLSADSTLRELFAYVSERFGGNYFLSLNSDNRYQKAAFIGTTVCKYCGKPLKLNKSVHVLKDSDLYHPDCPHVAKLVTGSEGEKLLFYPNEEDEILDLTLHEIGVPYLHILELFDDDAGTYLALELTADVERVMPEYLRRVAKR